MRWAYYNEHDSQKAEALRHMMRAGFIAEGEVDQRDIRDVTPNELSGFAQCHFFAGIGLWSAAARAAGIPDDFPFWSGSCPCQPFSAAGAGAGIADERHLWPDWHWLIAQCRPHAVVGEQVASKDGLAWLDLVCLSMEGSHYAGGAIDLCSAGFGAPNIRQRLYMLWLADADQGQRGRIADGEGCLSDRQEAGWQQGDGIAQSSGATCRLVDGKRAGLEGHSGHGDHLAEPGWIGAGEAGPASKAGNAGGLAGADRNGHEPRRLPVRSGQQGSAAALEHQHGQGGSAGHAGGSLRNSLPGPTNGFWAEADWLLCRDPDGPKLRPVKSGSQCLAAGYPGRNGELRGYGDAINLQVATAFLEAVWPEMKG